MNPNKLIIVFVNLYRRDKIHNPEVLQLLPVEDNEDPEFDMSNDLCKFYYNWIDSQTIIEYNEQ